MMKVNQLKFDAINSDIPVNKAAGSSDESIFTQDNTTAHTSSKTNLCGSLCSSVYDSYHAIFNSMPNAYNTGFNELEFCMNSIQQKGCQISEEAQSAIYSYIADEMGAILNDPSKTKEEKEEEINLLIEKAEAVKDDAVKKFQVLTKVMQACAKIAKATFLQDTKGMDFSKCFSGLNNIVNNLSGSCGNFDDAKNGTEIEDIKKENHKNILGSQDESSKTNELENEIKKQQEILDDPKFSQKDKIQAQMLIDSYQAQIEIYQYVQGLTKE